MKVIDAEKFRIELEEYVKNLNRFLGVHDIVKILDEQPEVETLKHGHWVELIRPCVIDGYEAEDTTYYCSVCHTSACNELDKYCSHCGAKMDEQTMIIDKSNIYDMECSVCGKYLEQYVYRDGEYICLDCANIKLSESDKRIGEK